MGRIWQWIKANASCCSNPETGQVADTIAAYKGRSGYSLWSPGGGYLLDYSADGTASIWDVFTKSDVKAFQGHNDIGSAFPWSTDGRRVAAVNAHETLDMWDGIRGSRWRATRWGMFWLCHLTGRRL